MADSDLILKHYIEINFSGNDIPLESFTKEERAQLASLLQDVAMGYAGFKRVQPPG